MTSNPTQNMNRPGQRRQQDPGEEEASVFWNATLRNAQAHASPVTP